MNRVEYECPNCRETIVAPPYFAGQSGRCPKCEQLVDQWPLSLDTLPATEGVPAKQRIRSAVRFAANFFRSNPAPIGDIAHPTPINELERRRLKWVAIVLGAWGLLVVLIHLSSLTRSSDSVAFVIGGCIAAGIAAATYWLLVPRLVASPDARFQNLWAWALVAVPVAGGAIELITGSFLPILLYFGLNSWFTAWDERRLKRAGLKSPSYWWGVLFVPAYLWRRATLQREPKMYFGCWAGSFAISIALALLLNTSSLESVARPLVTRIIKEQWRGGAKCVRVKITEHLGDGYHKAIATLDNGNDIRILIHEERDGIYVSIPTSDPSR